MKIGNQLFNEQQLRQFSKNMENIQKVQDKISSGKNIIFSSDDPVGAVQLSGMKDVLGKVDRSILLAKNQIKPIPKNHQIN